MSLSFPYDIPLGPEEMTEEERVAEIERWNSGRGGYLPEPVHLIIDRLLRIVRDQRAELTQARQAITNMRKHFDAEAENHKFKLAAVAAAVDVVKEFLK